MSYQKIGYLENLTKFKDEMMKKIQQNMEEKGFSWSDKEALHWLPSLFQKHIDRNDWVSVANIAFMLWENERLQYREMQK